MDKEKLKLGKMTDNERNNYMEKMIQSCRDHKARFKPMTEEEGRKLGLAMPEEDSPRTMPSESEIE